MYRVFLTLALVLSCVTLKAQVGQPVQVDPKVAEQVIANLDFGTLFNKLTQAETLALLDRNGLIKAGSTFEDIPSHLRPAGVLQILYWAPYKGQRLVGNPGQAYQKLIDAYKKNPFKLIWGISTDYYRLMSFLDDEAKSNSNSPAQPFRALVSSGQKAKLEQALAQNPEVPRHIWMFIDEWWSYTPKKLVPPQTVATQLAQNPDGLKVLYGGSNYDAALIERQTYPAMRYGVFDGDFEFSPAQYVAPHPGSTNLLSRYRGPWMDQYKTKIRNTGLSAETPESGGQGLEPYLRALKAIPGTRLDALVIDREDDPTWWNMLGESTPDGTPGLVKLTQDPRYAEYVQALGFEVPYKVPGTSKYVWRHGDEPSSKFNELNYVMQSKALESLGKLHQEIFPEMSWWTNYEHKFKTNLQPHYDNTRNTDSNFGIGATMGGGVGTNAMYGDQFVMEDYDLGLSTSAQAVNKDDWDALRGILAMSRSHCWASTQPFVAFHTNEHSTANMEAGRLWEEALIHSMMSNTHQAACVIFWLPSNTTDPKRFSGSQVDDFIKINALLDYTSKMIGKQDRRYIPPASRLDYTSPFVYSKLDVGGEIIWRVSAPPTGNFSLQSYNGDLVFRRGTASLKIPRGVVLNPPDPYLLEKPATDLSGDANHDGKVDYADLAILRQNRKTVPPPAGDLNQDGKIDGADFNILDATWLNGTGIPKRPGGYWVKQSNRTGDALKIWEQQKAITAFLLMFVGNDPTVFPDR